MNQPANPQPPLAVWWIAWAAIQSGVIVIYLFLGQNTSSTPAQEAALWQLGLLPVLISGAIRWSLLPAVKDVTKALICFVVGMSLAEVSGFLGLFVFPAHKLPLFLASVAGIFQFIPTYASRYYRASGRE